MGVVSGPPARTRWGRYAERTTSVSSLRSLPIRATSLVGERWKSRALQEVGEGLGVLGGRAREEAKDGFGLLLVGALAAQRR